MNKKIKQVVAGFLASASVLTTSACSSKVDCNIEKPHSHTYVTEERYERQIKSELEYVGDFHRKDEYNYVTDEEVVKLRETLSYELLRMEDNLDKLLALESSIYDYKQYEYKYTTRSVKMIGKLITHSTITHIDYTNDKEHSGLTGNERTVTHKFIGYKIVQDEIGFFYVVESEPMNSIEELIDAGYEYVKYGKLYASYDSETNEFIEYEDKMGKDKVSSLVLTK